MWIALIEEEEEVSVREVLEARGIVGHAIRFAREVLRAVTIAVDALVITGEAAQASGRPSRGDRTLAHSGDCRGVVREVFERGILDIVGEGHQVDLGKESRVF